MYTMFDVSFFGRLRSDLVRQHCVCGVAYNCGTEDWRVNEIKQVLGIADVVVSDDL